jgi:nitroimidazol reductase NimA-like FMN-containing flavoprotein (pyridoxamine 5'-phosphate oxidase superfamily)
VGIAQDFLIKNIYMIGKLTPEEIENLLHQQFIGHLGCQDKDTVYVVPVSYAYEGGNIYCHSFEGQKVAMMRNNRKVCFQVDEMKDMANWKSVITWGNFEEIDDEMERRRALHILSARRLPISSSITTHLGQTWPFTDQGVNVLKDVGGLFFRISLKEKSGEYESSSVSPQPNLGYVISEGIV